VILKVELAKACKIKRIREQGPIFRYRNSVSFQYECKGKEASVSGEATCGRHVVHTEQHHCTILRVFHFVQGCFTEHPCVLRSKKSMALATWNDDSHIRVCP